VVAPVADKQILYDSCTLLLHFDGMRLFLNRVCISMGCGCSSI